MLLLLHQTVRCQGHAVHAEMLLLRQNCLIVVCRKTGLAIGLLGAVQGGWVGVPKGGERRGSEGTER